MTQLIDLKDKKLLYYLSANARMSHVQLAKNVGLSKNAVAYRIERLKQMGIITKFSTALHLGNLGLETVGFLFSFADDIYQKQGIIDFFKNHPYANWVVSLTGSWDIFAEFIITDFLQLQQLVKEILTHFGAQLLRYETFFSYNIIKVEQLLTDFYKDILPELSIPPRKYNPTQLDKIDKKILYLLNQDASQHYLALVKQLDVSIDIVRYRMHKLETAGIILQYFPNINLVKLGYTNYINKIKLKNSIPEKLQQLQLQLRINQNIHYAFVDAITGHIIIACAFKTTEKVDQFSRELRTKYGEIVESHEYIIVKEQLAYNMFPKGLVEN